VTTISGRVAAIESATDSSLGELIPVRGGACVATSDDAVWVSSPVQGTVTRISTATRDIEAVIEVGGYPQGIVANSAEVWVATGDRPGSDTGEIVRIDGQTGAVMARVSMANLPEGLALTRDEVWASSNNGTVRAIDVTTAKLEPNSTIQATPGGRTTLASGGGLLWVATVIGPGYSGAIQPLTGDEVTPRFAPIPVGESPLGMVFGDGSLWVANYNSGTVTRIALLGVNADV
jgi:streptogramin lyase